MSESDPEAEPASASEPAGLESDADAELELEGEGDGLWRWEEGLAGLGFVVRDFVFEVLDDEDVVLGFVVFFGFGAALEGPAADADASPDARLGGLKGRYRRFWVGWRSGGMADAQFMCVFLSKRED